MANSQESGKKYTCANCGRTGAKGYKRKGSKQWECVSATQCASYKERYPGKTSKKKRTSKRKTQLKPPKTEQQQDSAEQNTEQKSDGEVAMRNGEPYRKYNWDRIRTLFIEGVPVDVADPDGDRDWLNLKELSERLQVPYQRIAQRSSKERWADKKVAYQAQITRERQQQRAKKLAGAATEFDDKALTVAQLGAQLVHARLGEIVTDVKDRQVLRQQAMAARQQGLPIDPAQLRTAIHSTELERLGKSMLMFQEIGMKALGTDIERHHVEGTVNVEQTVSVGEELERDDSKRLAGLLAAAHRSDVMADVIKELEAGDDDIVDAEIVDDGVTESTTNNGAESDGESVTKTAHEVVQETQNHDVDQTNGNHSNNSNGDNGKRSINVKRRR